MSVVVANGETIEVAAVPALASSFWELRKRVVLGRPVPAALIAELLDAYDAQSARLRHVMLTGEDGVT